MEDHLQGGRDRAGFGSCVQPTLYRKASERACYGGSQYLIGFLDSKGKPFDGAKTCKVALPKGIPAATFWSFTLYDNSQLPPSEGLQRDLKNMGDRIFILNGAPDTIRTCDLCLRRAVIATSFDVSNVYKYP